MKALVAGAGGFIGHHLVNRLKKEGYWVRGVDLKYPEFEKTKADSFVIADLRSQGSCLELMDEQFDEVFQLAADMGGAGYIFTGHNDAAIMQNSAMINLNMVEACRVKDIKKIFYASSACIYPEHNQDDADNPVCSEESAYPANPDSEYGWEKLFSERLYLAYCRNFGLDVRIARFHNIFGPMGTWQGGKEKAPAALCRKVAMAGDEPIQIWGDGYQTRSFLFIDECIEGIMQLMKSSFTGPVNIGSEEMVTINQLANMIITLSGKKLSAIHIPGPQGVRGRKSDNQLIREKLNWSPQQPLLDGLKATYQWIEEQIGILRK
ncbi:MAG: NAD-dependent epimerase/dehydratase family protein [Deltaproteobacteria bacterium]|nr:NAD-dependent epimerase/dehydratase family protein [Deltaproteobacteria bacterium]